MVIQYLPRGSLSGGLVIKHEGKYYGWGNHRTHPSTLINLNMSDYVCYDKTDVMIAGLTNRTDWKFWDTKRKEGIKPKRKRYL